MMVKPRFAALISIGVLVTAHVGAIANERRPNVVLIIGDDQGWTDYGFMGHPVIRTPHLDRLASESLVLPHGYLTAPLCRPSLASIVTGLYPHQHGVCGNDVDRGRRAESDLALREQFHRHRSWIHDLVDAGYLAFQSGKWWEGSWQDGQFTHGMTHGDPTRGGRHGDDGLAIGRQGLDPITKFIDLAIDAQQPFFVWYAPFLPHTPHNPPAEILAKYACDGRPENVAKYYAMCEWFDATCGQLLACLDERQIRDETLVLFLCDNGWAPVDPEADNPAGWWPDYAPRSKGSPFDLGIRTPMIVSWPGQVAGEHSPDLASSVDLAPTILHACKMRVPEDLPGIDLLDASARRTRQTVFGGVWSTHNMNPGDPQSTLQHRWCVTREWKLCLRHDGQELTRYRVLHEWDTLPARLYHIRTDPAEKTNLAERQADVVAHLSRQIDAVIPAR